ncbi:hypothetical protein C5S39_06220 [Candidatus Methanophagaceae archaeon]|nr:hypothetical protein C5S39_06220 [Methanophagales archaeon]
MEEKSVRLLRLSEVEKIEKVIEQKDPEVK